MEKDTQDIRLRNWEENFSKGFKEIEKFLDAASFVEKGIMNIVVVCANDITDMDQPSNTKLLKQT